MIFDPYPNPVSSFVLLSIGKFGQFSNVFLLGVSSQKTKCKLHYDRQLNSTFWIKFIILNIFAVLRHFDRRHCVRLLLMRFHELPDPTACVDTMPDKAFL